MKADTEQDSLQNLAQLIEEIAEDNVKLLEAVNRVLETQETLRADLTRDTGLLREDFAGALIYRVLKDLCGELIQPLTAMEAMLEQADFADARAVRGHVESLVITLHSVLSRMGAEKISVSVGEEIFAPKRHRCVRVLAPEESPFPSAPPRTIVRLVEDGYSLAGRILSPAKVEVQAEKRADDEGLV